MTPGKWVCPNYIDHVNSWHSGLRMEVEFIWLEIISAILQHSLFLYWDNNRQKIIHMLQFKKENIYHECDLLT
jgi:hypothetical protein